VALEAQAKPIHAVEAVEALPDIAETVVLDKMVVLSMLAEMVPAVVEVVEDHVLQALDKTVAAEYKTKVKEPTVLAVITIMMAVVVLVEKKDKMA
jgi:hypothetical protein